MEALWKPSSSGFHNPFIRCSCDPRLNRRASTPDSVTVWTAVAGSGVTQPEAAREARKLLAASCRRCLSPGRMRERQRDSGRFLYRARPRSCPTAHRPSSKGAVLNQRGPGARSTHPRWLRMGTMQANDPNPTRPLLHSDGTSFDTELAELSEVLAALPNPERVSYRNENALAIARDRNARLLVVAGPGSGKSFLFLDRIRFWLENGADKIYVSSFVRKLVRNLQNEIETRIGEEGRGVSATTLHTLARSLIERNHGTEELPLRDHVAVIAGWAELVWRDVLTFHPELSRSDYPRRAFETQLYDDAPSDTDEWRKLVATYDTCAVSTTPLALPT